jgi:hypothetical protein
MMKRLQKIQNLISNSNVVDASFNVDIVATHFLDSSNIYIPKNPFAKLKPGMHLIKDARRIRKYKKEAKENNTKQKDLERSAKRAKYIIRCNTFEHYVTFTFAHDRYNVDSCFRRMETWFENQKKKSRTGHFEYVNVVEFHKDGAIHFHALFDGYKGKIVPSINPKTGQQLRKPRPVYDLPAYTHGHVEVYMCDDKQKDRARLEHYLNKLEKYLTKEKVSLPPNRKRFWTTRGIKRPQKEYNPIWYTPDMVPYWKMENEWGTTLKFTKEQIQQAKQQTKDAV